MEEKSNSGSGKRQMQCPAEQVEKKVPKRARNPPKRFDEPAPGSPKADQDGFFVFLTFEDGYDAKIFKVCDVLHKDEKHIDCFTELKPGEEVLARWNDNKFYTATVNYIGRVEKGMDAKKTTKKDKNKDAAAQRFYSLPEVQSTSVQQKPISDQDSVTQQVGTLPQQHSPLNELPTLPSPTQPKYQSPLVQPMYQPQTPTQPSPTQPQYHSPLAQPMYQPQPPIQPSPTQPQYHSPLAQSMYQPQPPIQPSPTQPQYHSQLAQPVYQPLYARPQYYYPPTQPPHQPPPSQLEYQPLNQYSSQQTPDLNQQRYPLTPQKVTVRDSFLRMLYSPSVPGRSTVLAEESQASSSDFDNSTSSGDTYIIDRSPVPEYGEPCLKEVGAWKPCKECKAEVTKLMEEKKKLEEVLCCISGDQLNAFKSLLEGIEQLRPEVGVGSEKTGAAKQELYPESGLFVSSTRLAAIHAESKKDCLRLFHLLFDEFFSSEECQNAVAFGKHGKVPEGKTVLEKSKVNGLLTYVMHCGTWKGWTSVEKAKVKKALINKCRMRAKDLDVEH